MREAVRLYPANWFVRSSLAALLMRTSSLTEGLEELLVAGGLGASTKVTTYQRTVDRLEEMIGDPEKIAHIRARAHERGQSLLPQSDRGSETEQPHRP